MANSKQALKRDRQNIKRNKHNTHMRSSMRNALKKAQTAIESGEIEGAQSAYAKAVPLLDRMTRKGIIHKNKAARYKSRLNKHIKALAKA